MITIRHVATHTATLIDTKQFWRNNYVLAPRLGPSERREARVDVLRAGNTRVPMAQFVRNIVVPGGAWYSKNNFLKKRPGTTSQYSNLGAAVAALVVEHVTGVDFATYTEKYIFTPLGMLDSGWSFDKVTLGRFLHEMIKGYRGESTLLEPASFREMMSSPSRKPGTAGYGIFWSIRPDGSIGHGGADPGTTTSMFFNPADSFGTVVFTNYTLSSDRNDPARRQFQDVENALRRALLRHE